MWGGDPPPPVLVNAEHCKYIMRRFEAKRRIMYLQCSALTKMGGGGDPLHIDLIYRSFKKTTQFCYVGYVRYSSINSYNSRYFPSPSINVKNNLHESHATVPLKLFQNVPDRYSPQHFKQKLTTI